jgi:glyoxylase-like metal-dependent hydrolase (beta-lactamase superfamily II)/quercetin dioxygenase-like cupin family protein
VKHSRPLASAFLLAVLIAGSGVALAQQPGIKRTDLQRSDLSVPGREVVQVRVDLAPGVAFGRHRHPGEEIVYVIEGRLEYEVEGKPPVTLEAGEVLFIPAGAIHAARNVGTVNGAELATYLVEKGKPLVEMAGIDAASAPAGVVQGAAGEPYPGMPAIAPIGVSIGKYIDVPGSARGPAIDPASGYRLQDLGKGLHMVTDGVYQSMFLVYDRGVVVIDAPPAYAARIPQAIAEVTDKPVTHVVYSHSHTDHIGGVTVLGGRPVIIAHEETLRLLKRAADPKRPLPTVTFADRYTLRAGGQVLELSYHGNGHEPGNIFIHAPAQRVLMVVDVVFPGWMPWRRFAVAQDVQGSLAQVEEIRKMDWDTLVGGHVARTGTHADVDTQAEFIADIRQAAAKALATTRLGESFNPLDQANPWAVFDNYIDRVAAQCVLTLTPKWSTRLAAFDVYVWDQCYSMEQSLRIE